MLKRLSHLLALLLTVPAFAAGPEVPDVWLGPPPLVTSSAMQPPLEVPFAGEAPTLTVDTLSRSAVASFFNVYYTPNLSVPMGWTGSIAGCVPGTTSAAYLDATIEMINYYRAMTGLPSITNEVSLNDDCQDTALMMIAEGSLSHSPGGSWACYTAQGAAAAGSSNLALGNAGPSAIVAYIRDSGVGNEPVGHRRWILYPPQLRLATGSNDGVNYYHGSNALYVFAAWTARPTSPSQVSWPPAGYVPYPVVYPRWSFSLNSNPYASFSAATVTMTQDGVARSVNVISRTAGYGDPTIVWEPSGIVMGPGMNDSTVTVTVANIGNNTPSSVTYDVVIMDPAIASDDIFIDGFESGDYLRWSSWSP